jgi:hypothetical protein
MVTAALLAIGFFFFLKSWYTVLLFGLMALSNFQELQWYSRTSSRDPWSEDGYR